MSPVFPYLSRRVTDDSLTLLPSVSCSAVLRWVRSVAIALALPAVCVADTYTAAFRSPDEISIVSDGFTASGNTIDLSLAFTPTQGWNLTVINNTGRNFITGSFSNLAQGQSVQLTYAGKTYRYIANYFGGTGNDLVLQWAATRLVGWGYNFYGQLGTGDTRNQELATAVTTSSVLANQTITGVATGGSHSLALLADGKLIAWGSNSYGALGDTTTTNHFEPVTVYQSGVLAGRTVVAVDAGYCFSVALTSDGKVFAWGYNADGQLGNGTTNITANSSPLAVSTSGLLATRKVVASRPDTRMCWHSARTAPWWRGETTAAINWATAPRPPAACRWP